jgi:hypothetical protein
MNNPNLELVIPPFTAKLKATTLNLTFDQVMFLLQKENRSQIQIERSYPGSPQAIGWTIFHRTPEKYLHKNEPFFRSERGARRHIRQAYAIHYALAGDEGLTHSHLSL